VLYGHGAAPLHLTLPGHETMLALKHTNVLLTIQLDGKDHLAIAKDVQRNALRDLIEHVDLLTVAVGEKITVTVPVRVIGESAPGTIHLLESQTVSVAAEATHLPEFVEAFIDGLEGGSAVRASELRMPEGVTYLGDPEELIVAIAIPQMTLEEEEVGEELAEEGAEGDLAAEPGVAETAEES
jgi:large subunit ribosomal protein L25